MITQVNESELMQIDEVIGNNYFKCLYLYMDYKRYGTNDKNVKIWVQKSDNKIYTVILKYYTGMHIFSTKIGYNVEELIDLINSENPAMICGEKILINCIERNMKNSTYESEYGWVRKLYKLNDCVNCDGIVANKNDFYSIAKLIYEDEDLGSSYKLEELANQMYERNKDGFSRNYVIKKDNKVVSHVATGAEYEKIAMISYVVTDKKYRHQGLATKLLNYTCKQLIEENKEIYLINYSKESSSLYDKIGFNICCEWGKLFLNLKK